MLIKVGDCGASWTTATLYFFTFVFFGSCLLMNITVAMVIGAYEAAEEYDALDEYMVSAFFSNIE